jgi:hypothetical protein
MTPDQEKKRDVVTVGQLRARQLKQLEDQILTLNKLIRQGYSELPKAEQYLEEAIGKTLTTLQNIDALASTEVLFPN